MKRVIPLAALMLAGLSPLAAAADSGFYLGAGLATGSLSACYDSTGSCNSFSADSQDSFHPRVIGGYDFNKYIGIEAGVSGLGKYKVQNNLGATAGTVEISALTLAAKGGYTFPHGWSVFGKLGLASVNTKYTADPGWVLNMSADQNTTGFVMGLGGQYNFNDAIGLRLFTEIVAYSDAAYTGAVGGTTMMAVFKF